MLPAEHDLYMNIEPGGGPFAAADVNGVEQRRQLDAVVDRMKMEQLRSLQEQSGGHGNAENQPAAVQRGVEPVPVDSDPDEAAESEAPTPGSELPTSRSELPPSAPEIPFSQPDIQSSSDSRTTTGLATKPTLSELGHGDPETDHVDVKPNISGDPHRLLDFSDMDNLAYMMLAQKQASDDVT